MSAPARTPRARATGVFAARARRRRLRRLLAVAALVGAVIMVSGTAWLVGWSGVLAVNAVSVEGAGDPLDDGLAEEVRVAAGAPMGTPLARVDTGAVTERVLALPEVADVEISRSWPTTLTIEVTPRVGVATVRAGDTWWQLDESGVMFAEATARPESLPVLTAPAGEDDEKVRAAGVAVLTGLPADVRKLVKGVEAKSEADIRLELADDVEVKWGTADRIDDKAAVLLALIAAQEDAPSAYDVSAPDHPAVTP